ncbi:hypothetical protein BDZ94DRAFT_1271543, partial [Collybia nuda]
MRRRSACRRCGGGWSIVSAPSPSPFIAILLSLKHARRTVLPLVPYSPPISRGFGPPPPSHSCSLRYGPLLFTLSVSVTRSRLDLCLCLGLRLGL